MAAQTFATVTGEASDTADTVNAEIIALLVELLAELAVPEHAQPLADALYEDLQEGLAWDELVPMLDRVVMVVTATLNRDQEEFGEFLKSLDQRLVALNAFLSFFDAQQQGLGDQTAQLNNQLDDQISAIREDC